MRFSSSSKTSQSRFVKMSGRMKSLNFGASCAPRMLHAASQIQDSSDLSLALFILPRWLGCWEPNVEDSGRRAPPAPHRRAHETSAPAEGVPQNRVELNRSAGPLGAPPLWGFDPSAAAPLLPLPDAAPPHKGLS